MVAPGDILYLNDGLIEVNVEQVRGSDVRCRVIVGGELDRTKGLNLPGIDLGIRAFTEHDQNCMKFALENGVDAVSQSFVENAADIQAVRDAAAALGYRPFIIAKIERSRALYHWTISLPRQTLSWSPGRPRRGTAHRAGSCSAETDHTPGEHARQTRNHGNPNAGIDDQQPASYPC